MQSHTHAAVGACIGAAMTINAPVEVAAAGTAVAVVGAIISDIDVGGTGKRSTSWLVAGCSAALMAVPVVLGMVQQWAALGLFVLTCVYGALQEHRSFMHSIFAMVLLVAAIYVAMPNLPLYFAAGFLSHLLLDIITHRPVQLLYPLEKSVSLKLCYSKSRASQLLFLLGCAGTIILIIIRFL